MYYVVGDGDNGGGCACVGLGIYRTLDFPLNFSVKVKLFLKMMSRLKEKPLLCIKAHYQESKKNF